MKSTSTWAPCFHSNNYKQLVCFQHVLERLPQQQQHPFNGPFPGLPGSAGTGKVKPIWILLKQETVSGSGISWDICKSAPRSRQIPCQNPTTQFLQAGYASCHPTNSVKALKATSNKCIAVHKVATPLRELTCHMGSQCYLPPGRGDIPALTPAEAGTRLSDPGGMQG